MKFIRILDNSGSTIDFNINGKPKLKSFIGGIMTIILFIIFLILFFFLGRNFYNRTNPNISFSYETPYGYFNYTLDSTSFLFAFRVDNQDGQLVDRPEIFYYEPHYIVYKKTSQGNLKLKDEILKFHRCKRSDVNNHSIYDIQALQDWYCFEWPREGLTVGGLLDNELTQYIKIKLKNCNNSPKQLRIQNNITCSKDISLLNDIFERYIYFSVIIQDYRLDAAIYEKPFTLGFNNLYEILDLNFQKKKYYYLKKGLLHDDKGWISEAIKENELIGLSQTKFDFITSKDDKFEMTYFECNLYFDNVIEKYSRTYIKIQEIISQLGGLVKSFSFFIYILTGIYNNYIRDLFILNNSYDIFDARKINFSSNEKRNENYTEFNKIQEKHKNCKCLFDVIKLTPSVNSNKANNISNRETDQLCLPRIKIKFNFLLFINKFCCFYKNKNNNNIKIFQESKKLILDKLDIVNFIRRLITYDKALELLFSSDQLTLISRRNSLYLY